MAASVQCKKQERNFGTVMEIRKDDDLALFHELENRAMEKNEFFLHESNDFGDQIGVALKQDRSSIFKTAITVPPRRTGVDAFLNSENDKTDYDWLLTPPDTPLFPSLEMEKNNNAVNQISMSHGYTTAQESKHAKQQTQPVPKNNETFTPLLPSTSSNRRPSSSGGPTPTSSRPATPTSRATLPTTKKLSRPSTPTSRPTLVATTKPTRSSTPTSRPIRPSTSTSRDSLPSTTNPNRPSTPTSRASLPSTTKANRSSTPTSHVLLHSTTKPNRPSTPTSRASLTATTKPSRPSTPTSRTSLPATTKPSRPLTPTSRPTLRSSTPTRSSVVKNPGPSRGSSPTMKSRPLKDTPSARSSSNGRTRQNVSAPNSGFSVLAMSRRHSMNGDDVNPVLMGTKMVERVVNMRKLVPPKQDDHVSNNSSGKSMSSQGNLGRTLSKTSLDMAIRHMDITKRIPGNLRPLVTNIPASSVYSVRSGPTKSKTVSSSDSPLATSSNSSSEPSVNNGPAYIDSIEVEESNFPNEREKYFPAAE